jgi:hypothetical protein
VVLDYNGDKKKDLAIGAPGESAVYVVLGPDFKDHHELKVPDGIPGSLFGTEMAKTDLDENGRDEIIIGAPGCEVEGQSQAGKVFILGQDLPQAIVLQAQKPWARAGFGTSLGAGDLDGDGAIEILVGAPRGRVKGVTAGAVHVMDPLKKEEKGLLKNPQKNKVGNFGHVLAVADGDHDGILDLFVSALGNHSKDGIQNAGQIVFYKGPLPQKKPLVIENPKRKARDGARFGMDIFARDINGDGRADLAVGSPRSDVGNIRDAGFGFLFFGPDFDGEKALAGVRSDPVPKSNDILGFRTCIGNILGDPTPEAVFSSLPTPGRGRARGLVIWDGAGMEEDPRILYAMKGASDHYIQGLSLGQLDGKGYEELVLGDPNFDRGPQQDVGRVMIAFFE